MAFKDSKHVTEALKAIEKNYYLMHTTIMSPKLVSKEAEKLAITIIDNHFACSLYLNSNVKALRPSKQKGIVKRF